MEFLNIFRRQHRVGPEKAIQAQGPDEMGVHQHPTGQYSNQAQTGWIDPGKPEATPTINSSAVKTLKVLDQ